MLRAGSAGFGVLRAIKQYDAPKVFSVRTFTRTSSVLDDAEAAAKKEAEELSKAETKLRNRKAALDYNNRRAEYKRQVKQLRKQYADEAARLRARDEAERLAKEKIDKRRGAETKRLKAIRAGQTMLREEEKRQKRHQEWQEYLDRQQQKRNERLRKYTKARQMVIDELEEEAPTWMTTLEEVEAAFTHEATQLLWSFPGGVLGSTNPSTDSHYWQMEAHPNTMYKSYLSRRELLLIEVMEDAYEFDNIDENFWTQERLEEHIKLQQKARLRAHVRAAGRAALLYRQAEVLQDHKVTRPGEVPKLLPVPTLKAFADNKILEQEGARLLFKDPTRFFEFEESEDQNDQELGSSGYSGPSLGSPIGLRDPMYPARGFAVPKIVGVPVKENKMSNREKKQKEREEKLLAAAQAEAKKQAEESGETYAEFQTDEVPDVDYDEEYDSDEEDLKKRVYGEALEKIMEVPNHRRFELDEIKYVMDKLKKKKEIIERLANNNAEYVRDKMIAEARKIKGGNVRLREDELFEPGSIELALAKLDGRKVRMLIRLDHQYAKEGVTEERILEVAGNIPELTVEQLKTILERER